jgi:hypothetical protein
MLIYYVEKQEGKGKITVDLNSFGKRLSNIANLFTFIEILVIMLQVAIFLFI